jgi:hypothetical protein
VALATRFFLCETILFSFTDSRINCMHKRGHLNKINTSGPQPPPAALKTLHAGTMIQTLNIEYILTIHHTSS